MSSRNSQVHLLVAKRVIDKHQTNLIECVDALDRLHMRMELLVNEAKGDEPAYFTLLSIQEDMQRIRFKLWGEAE